MKKFENLNNFVLKIENRRKIMKIQLKVLEAKTTDISVTTQEVLDLKDFDSLQKLQKNLQERIDKKEGKFSFGKEIKEILSNFDFEIDTNSKKIKTENGRISTKTIDISEQRKINKVLDAIEEAYPDEKYEEEKEIELKKVYFDYVFERIEKYYNYAIVIANKNRIELFDYLSELKEEAKKTEE